MLKTPESSRASSSEARESSSSGPKIVPSGTISRLAARLAASTSPGAQQERRAGDHLIFDSNSNSSSNLSSASDARGSMTAGEQRRHQAARQVVSAALGCDTAGTRGAETEPDSNTIPREAFDDNGKFLSVGSSRHGTMACKPCILMPTCHRGVECFFCHAPSHIDASARSKIRPCKGKREQYQKLIKRTSEEIQRNPETFDIDSVRMPSFVDSNPSVKKKFRELMSEKFSETMKLHQEKARGNQPSGVKTTTPLGSGEASSSCHRTSARPSQALGETSTPLESGEASSSELRPNIVRL